MKTYQLVVFLSVVFIVYALVNLYIFTRGIQSFTPGSKFKTAFIILFLGLSSSYILARFLERAYPSVLADIFMWIGSFWLAIMLYFFLIVVFLDFIRLINHFLPFYPKAVIANFALVKQYIFYGAIAFVGIVILLGYINASNPLIRNISIDVPKKPDSLKQLNIVAVSDIHLGTIISNGKLERIVNKINSLEPDIILLAGDVIDENVDVVIRRNMGESLKKLQSKYGTFAITGNHEYIGGAEKAVNYLSSHNITMLRDTALFIDSSFYIVGREDKEKSRYSGIKRKTLKEILNGVNISYPIISMDHQPFNLNESKENGIDLQLSGHTHHGQMFPFDLITKSIYEVSWGFMKDGNTNYYITSGIGTWGPPVRIGNRPEIVNIRLRFKE